MALWQAVRDLPPRMRAAVGSSLLPGPARRDRRRDPRGQPEHDQDPAEVGAGAPAHGARRRTRDRSRRCDMRELDDATLELELDASCPSSLEHARPRPHPRRARAAPRDPGRGAPTPSERGPPWARRGRALACRLARSRRPGASPGSVGHRGRHRHRRPCHPLRPSRRTRSSRSSAGRSTGQLSAFGSALLCGRARAAGRRRGHDDGTAVGRHRVALRPCDEAVRADGRDDDRSNPARTP